jgi:hypothetical protein
LPPGRYWIYPSAVATAATGEAKVLIKSFHRAAPAGLVDLVAGETREIALRPSEGTLEFREHETLGELIQIDAEID